MICSYNQIHFKIKFLMEGLFSYCSKCFRWRYFVTLRHNKNVILKLSTKLHLKHKNLLFKDNQQNSPFGKEWWVKIRQKILHFEFKIFVPLRRAIAIKFICVLTCYSFSNIVTLICLTPTFLMSANTWWTPTC